MKHNIYKSNKLIIHHIMEKQWKYNYKANKGTHLSIVTERSPQACKPARTIELLWSSATCLTSSGCLPLSTFTDMLVKDFNISIDITRHVIVLGTLRIPFPELTKERQKCWLQMHGMQQRQYLTIIMEIYDNIKSNCI